VSRPRRSGVELDDDDVVSSAQELLIVDVSQYSPLAGGGQVRHKVVGRAVVVATGITATGHREVLGLAVGDTSAALASVSELHNRP
jgi:hypothetical protein